MANNKSSGIDLMLELVDSRWKALIIDSLSYGEQKYSELKSSLSDIPCKEMTSEIRDLKNNRIIERISHGPTPVVVYFRLPPLGEEIHTMLLDSVNWKDMTPVSSTTNSFDQQ